MHPSQAHTSRDEMPGTCSTATTHQQNITHPHPNNNQPKDRGIVILLVNIDGIRNRVEELKDLVHRTQPVIIRIQEAWLKWKVGTPKCPLHHRTHRRGARTGRGLITLIKDDMAFTNMDIPKAIGTRITGIQLVKMYMDNTGHITVADTCFPSGDTASPHCGTMNIAWWIRHVTNITESILTGDVNAQSTTLVLTHWQP